MTRPCGRYAWVVAADSTQGFAPIEHDGMGRLVAERRADGALRRLGQQGRQAGGRNPEGQGRHPVTGPPQGGPGSPLLAKVVRPDALDLRWEKVG
jgi:hypothetical protein